MSVLLDEAGDPLLDEAGDPLLDEAGEDEPTTPVRYLFVDAGGTLGFSLVEG